MTHNAVRQLGIYSRAHIADLFRHTANGVDTDSVTDTRSLFYIYGSHEFGVASITCVIWLAVGLGFACTKKHVSEYAASCEPVRCRDAGWSGAAYPEKSVSCMQHVCM